MIEKSITINNIIHEERFESYKGILVRVVKNFNINVINRNVFDEMKSGAPKATVYNKIVARRGRGKSHFSTHFPKDEGKIIGS